MNDFTRKMGKNPVENRRCAARPYGCGKDLNLATEFKDALSRKEYNISGLCQSCQDSVFESEDNYEDDREQFELNQLVADRED